MQILEKFERDLKKLNQIRENFEAMEYLEANNNLKENYNMEMEKGKEREGKNNNKEKINGKEINQEEKKQNFEFDDGIKKKKTGKKPKFEEFNSN